MIRIFSNTYNQTIFLLFVFTILIRFFGFYNPYITYNFPANSTILADFFIKINQIKYLGVSLSTLIIFLSAIQLNQILLKNDVLFMPSFLSALFFVLLNSIFSDQLYFGPVIIANWFVIIAFGQILSLYHSNNPLLPLFFASFLIGLTVLLNISYLAFCVVIIIGLNLFRPFSLKETSASLIGLIMPIYISSMINYLIYSTFLPFKIVFPDYGIVTGSINWFLNSPLPLVLLIGLFSFLRMFKNYVKNTSKTRRSIQFLVVMLIISLFIFLTGKQNQKQEFSFLTFPMAVYFTFYFSTYRIKWYKEVLFLLLLISIVYFQIFGKIY